MKKFLLKNWQAKNSPGETLLEVIIALLVVTMGAATATTLIILAIDANIFNRDSLVAVNLAQEGLEYMRNLRDSNWITYSADKENCWNMAPNVVGGCVAPYNEAIAAANSASNTGGYPLGTSLGAAIGTNLDLSDGISPAEAGYQINSYDLDSATNSDGVGGSGDDKDIMGSGISGAGITTVNSTKYYRSIEIAYEVIGPAPSWTLSAAATPQVANLMIVTSRVQWMDGPTMHEIKLNSALSNYKQ